MSIRGIAACVGLASFVTLALADDGVRVQVASPKVVGATELFRVSGSVNARQQAGLSPRVDGLIAVVRVDAGSVVDKGDVILELDDALVSIERQRARAEVSEAQAALSEARRLVEEASTLTTSRHLPKTELGRRESGLAQASAALEAARAAEADVVERQRRHRLIAPFDGVVLEKHVESGEWITRGTPAVEFASLSEARLDVRVSQERIAKFDADTPVTVIPDTDPTQRMEARIESIVPIADAQTRTFLVRVVPAKSGSLTAGTSATAEFKLPGKQVIRRIPRSALQRQPDGSYSVFAIEEQGASRIARRYKVTVGRDLGEQREILSGLPDGLEVVTRGGEVLKDGQRVQLDSTE